MLSNIIANMHPDSSSIECIMLERVPGVQPQFRNRSGVGLSEQDREMNPYIIAEVKNPNGFSSLQQNSIVLVPLNHCRFLPEEGKVCHCAILTFQIRRIRLIFWKEYGQLGRRKMA